MAAFLVALTYSGFPNMTLLTHWRIVAALLIREMSTRFGKRPGGYLWAVVQPAGMIFMMTLVFQAVMRSPALGSSFPLFYATGYICYQFYQSTLTYVRGAVENNSGLLGYPTVAPIDTVVARLFLQIGTIAIVAIVVFSVIMEFTMRQAPAIDWKPVLETFFLANFLALGVAMNNIILFSKFPLYESIYKIITRPLPLISGIFFIPDSIPQPYRDFVLANPIAHLIMLFRTGFYPDYRAVGLNVDYLYWCVFTTLFFGCLFFRVAAKTLRSES